MSVTCPTPSAAERLIDILSDYGLALSLARGRALGDWPAPGEIDVAVAALADGFELPDDGLVVLTEQNVFGQRQQRRAVRITRQTNAIERLAQIQEGDFLVHAEHGIGRFGGLQRISVSGFEQEFLLLLYDKGDKLYVPASRLGQVQRYASAEDASPALDRLGGNGWTRTRSRVRRAVQDMAEALLAALAARETLEGTAFPPPDALYEEFEARFKWDDTPDQRKATDDVLRDRQKRRPMDRLVCGDGGFG